MDQTKKIKLNTREFFAEHKKVGFIVGVIFMSLFLIYLAIMIFFSSLNDMSAKSQIQAQDLQTADNGNFVERLFPEFKEVGQEILDQSGLPAASGSSSILINTITGLAEDLGVIDRSIDVNTIEIEKDPVLSYVVFNKPTSIKKFIQTKPSVCLEKIQVIEKLDEKSKAVENFQNTLKSMTGFEDIEVTGTLDENTRERIFTLQSRYAKILYKSKANKEPTRLMDKETTHFLNLLCGFDKEEPDDFINIPTLRYSKKTSREVFDYNTQTKEKIPLNNSLATGTEEAIFSPDGKYVVFRGEGKNDVRGNSGEIVTEFVNLENQGRQILEKNIDSLDFNSKGLLVYGVPEARTLAIKVYDPERREVRRLATIPMKEWSIYWVGDGSTGEIAMFNKPSAYAEGILMILNTTTKRINKIVGPQFGLSINKTNLTDYSIGSIGGIGNLRTVLINNKTRSLSNLGLSTYAEKCSSTITFNGIFCAVPKNIPQGYAYPDDWYKQKISTEDVLVYRAITGTTTRIISDFPNKSFSIIKLQIDSNGIYFLDEKTLSLYSLED